MYTSASMIGQEHLYLSLSPFTVISFFVPDMHDSMLPYLDSKKKETLPKGTSSITQEILQRTYFISIKV